MRQSAIKIKDGILSFVISAIGVGALVWNAYMLNNVGYPNWFSNIGEWIVRGSLIFAILPAIPLIYFLLQYRRKRRARRVLLMSKNGKKSGANP